MGGIVSTGHNNDDLIDNLLEVDYIKTSTVERVFRAVDRAEYFLPEVRGNAYKDVAWKSGNLHLSAPCIYSEVMEGLCLEPGLSFLNLGSGTGYLSTMIGLILGENGLNHGIEYYEDVIQYANTKLEEFKKYSGAIDEFNFCQPAFVKGNCLYLNEGRLYDRVYCGASCPSSFEPYMKNLLKIGGILVVPINEHLMQFKRISENVWNSKMLLPVSFAPLIQSPNGNNEMVSAIEIHPKTLQELTRGIIRNILRANIELELPPVTRKGAPKKAPRKKRVLKRFVVPLFEDDSSDEDIQTRNELRAIASLNNDYENFFSHVIDTLRFRTGGSSGNVEAQQAEHVEDSEGDAGVSMDIDNANGGGNSSVSMIANDGSSCSEESAIRRAGGVERKKFDSGIGEDGDLLEVSEPDDNTDERDKSYLSTTTSDEDQSKRTKRSSKLMGLSRPKWRRIALEPNFSSSSDTDNENSNMQLGNGGGANIEMRMYESRYTQPMKEKIQKLPLPQILKNYLNFYRDF